MMNLAGGARNTKIVTLALFASLLCTVPLACAVVQFARRPRGSEYVAGDAGFCAMTAGVAICSWLGTLGLCRGWPRGWVVVLHVLPFSWTTCLGAAAVFVRH